MAFGAGTISSLGGAVSDLFAGQAAGFKAKGSEFEKRNYLLASDLAEQNARFTETSTAIKQAQLAREVTKTTGGMEADVAGAGFAEGGTALDLLRESASQGALTHAVAGQQGLITEAGYKEQAQSYQNMASAAQVAIDADKAAQEGSFITAGLKVAGAVASVGLAPFTGGASLAGLASLASMGGGAATPTDI